MIVAAHQPLFIPWIGYFDKINKSDLFVIVDNVQFTSYGWIRRNSIKTCSGSQLVTVPIHRMKEILGKKINDVKIDNQLNEKWKRNHLNSFQVNYGKSPYFTEVFIFLKDIYDKPFELLSEFNYELIKFICGFLKIETKLVLASELNASGSKTDLIIDICKKTEATSFILGMGGSNIYADRKKIESNGIIIVEQNFNHPTYNQLFGEFIPRLSVLDFLFNEGPNASFILSGNKTLNRRFAK
jgi:WbqC-like protein family